ncbi:MAG: hypothetical protein J5781_07180, partial [Clostridia bacterium]|nr:hypothetical protein [Clostridia bacterium]
LIGAVLAGIYYAVLFGISLVRLFIGIGGKIVGHPSRYFIIDHLTSSAAFVCAVTMAADMIVYWAFMRNYSVGYLLIGTVAPVLVVADYLFFAPHKSNKCYACALIYPILYCGVRFFASHGFSSAWKYGTIVLIYVAVCFVLYFIGMKAEKKYGIKKIPYPLLWHDMPVDISSAFGKEEAGCHGFLKADGENFVFEDGTPVKFWGVNFNSAQNFPEHSHSEKVAKRLARAGVNIVRFHQLDAEWAAPNIFAFKKGKRVENTRSFDEESLERLDYLVYCLKKEGIYIYLDFLTYRRFRVGDGVINAEKLPEAAKPYCVFDRTLIELQKEYNRNLLTHVNKYTGVAYKDEPAIVLAEVVNECDLLDAEYTKITVEPYRSQLLERYRAYAKEQGVENPNEDIDKRTDPFMRKFLLEVQKAYVWEIIDDIRKTGAKFPMTAMNRESDRTVILTNGVTDFSDSHAYWRGGDQRGFMNDPMSLQPTNVMTRQLVTNAIDGKPFFVSEWDAPWPNEYRADATLWTAAVGALQNWSGFALHTYRYGTAEQDYITEKLGRSIALGGSFSRGLFDCYNDPAKMGLFYHAALLFRRGDVSEAKEKTVVSFSEEEYLSCEQERHLKKTYSPRYEEWKKLRFAEGKNGVKTLKKVPADVCSDTQELKRWKGKGYIDSPRTQAVYGFCSGKNVLKDVTFDVKNDFATIAVSSLSDLPIKETDSLLLTAVGRADNTDGKYNLFHTVLKKEGRAPILADVIAAKVAIRTKNGNMKVWAVNNEGSLVGQMKTSYDGEYFRFEIGKTFESIYYLIQKQ